MSVTAGEISVYVSFQDEDGRQWGRVEYYYGPKNCWICLDDPFTKDLPVRELPELPVPFGKTHPFASREPVTDSDRTENESSTQPVKSASWKDRKNVLAVCLVVFVVVITVVLIPIFWKKKDRTKH